MKKILIVEDEDFIANLYRLKLEKSGYQVEIVPNGAEVAARLEKFLPDLILLDILLPIKDGFTVLEELKKDERWKNIPVIITSNLGQKEDIDKARKLGAAEFIVKSNVSLEDITSKIGSLLKIL